MCVCVCVYLLDLYRRYTSVSSKSNFTLTANTREKTLTSQIANNDIERWTEGKCIEADDIFLNDLDDHRNRRRSTTTNRHVKLLVNTMPRLTQQARRVSCRVSTVKRIRTPCSFRNCHKAARRSRLADRVRGRRRAKSRARTTRFFPDENQDPTRRVSKDVVAL